MRDPWQESLDRAVSVCGSLGLNLHAEDIKPWTYSVYGGKKVGFVLRCEGPNRAEVLDTIASALMFKKQGLIRLESAA